MGSNHRILSLLLVWLMLVGTWFAGAGDGTAENGYLSAYRKDTLYLWYTDEILTDYINSVALAFYDDYDVRVVPVLQTGLEYAQAINAASVSGNEVPDLYLTGSDSLEKLIMSGLASEAVAAGTDFLTETYFPRTALDAVTYQGHYYAYPFYYETAFLLYNKTYLREMADAVLREELTANAPVEEASEIDEEEDDGELGIPDGYSEAEWDALVEQKMETMLPDSIGDILEIADTCNPPEKVENIFLWDVSDILYNYFFAGAYMNVGGPCGDDASVIEIYNEDTIECMRVYQELHQFFSIESKESSYANVLQEFIDGKSIFTIATTDALGRIEEERADGGFPYEYGVSLLPSIDDEHLAKGLSVTNVVVINGYSGQKELANRFAEYLVYENADTLYERTDKMQAAYPMEDFVTDVRDQIMMFYEHSTSLPKILEISNFWVQLELAYTKVWDGQDVDDVLRQLSEQMKTQISGEEVVEPVLPVDAPEL